MSKIRKQIESVNKKGQKALTVFLTSGFPNPDCFVNLVLNIERAGADIIEIGLPFADSLADGPVIQASYLDALKYNVNIEMTFSFISEIRKKSDIPLIIMSSANPILNYGKRNFVKKAIESGVDGVIFPDIPLEEYDSFFENDFSDLDTILLTTPISTQKRIKEIDIKSSGFLYCVSVLGTTGIRNNFDNHVIENLKRTYSLVENNKMQIGFGISSPNDVKQFSPFCDGVIVGSAIIKSIKQDKGKFEKTLNLISELKKACNG